MWEEQSGAFLGDSHGRQKGILGPGIWVPGTGKRNARERTGFPRPVLGPGLTPWGLGQELRMPENRAEAISRCGQRQRKEPSFLS